MERRRGKEPSRIPPLEPDLLPACDPARQRGLVGDRLAGMQDVEIAALDRRLGLDLAAAGPRRQLDRTAVLDHLEGSAGAFELCDDLVPDPTGRPWRAKGLRLVGIARDGVQRGGDVIAEGVRAHLAAAN